MQVEVGYSSLLICAHGPISSHLGTYGKNTVLLIVTMVFLKKHHPNSNRDGYHYCIWDRALNNPHLEKSHMRKNWKNTILIVTAMGKIEKTRSKLTNMGGMSTTCLLVTARLQISSEEYFGGVLRFKFNFPRNPNSKCDRLLGKAICFLQDPNEKVSPAQPV